MKQYTVKHTVAVVGLVAFLLSVMWTIMPQTIHAFSWCKRGDNGGKVW